MSADDVDFSSCLTAQCPLCEERCGYREIAPYARRVVELSAELQVDEVLIARFQCRRSLRTFSLLPHQLAPYHSYTVASMVYALLLVTGDVTPGRRARLQTAVDELAAESAVTSWLVYYWLRVLQRGLRRGHADLMRRYDLSMVISGESLPEALHEVGQYLERLCLRGPPSASARTNQLLWQYALDTQRFLVGTPSQERR